MVQSWNARFDLDLWPIWPWHFEPKINRGPFRVKVNTCVKYHHCMANVKGVIVRKRCEVELPILMSTIDLLNPKSIEVLSGSWSIDSIHVWSNIIYIIQMYGKRQWSYSAETTFSTDREMDRQTDAQTAKGKPVYPSHNFVGGSLITLLAGV